MRPLSWDGGLPAQQPAPHFYQTFQRDFLFARKSNKHLSAQNSALPRALFLHCSRWRGQPASRDGHRLETSSLFNIFIARTETSTRGSAQHRHGTSWGRLPGRPAPPWHVRFASAPGTLAGHPLSTPLPCSWDGGLPWGHPLVVPPAPPPAPGLAPLQCCPGLACSAGDPLRPWELREPGR